MTAASLPSTRTDEAGHSLADMKDMAVDAQGALWLVNQNKLVRFDGKTATEYISDFSLDKVDADGMDIYLASTTAFIKFKDGHFDATPLHYWSIDRSIAPTHSGSIDRDGNYHAGARGLFKLRPDGTCEELSFFKGKHISSTTSDKNGDIWVACSWASPFCLYKITPTDTLAYTERDGCPPLGEEDIFQMAVDKHNRLWIASSKGLHCFDGTSWQTFDKSNSGLTTDRVYCIAFDREGRLRTSCGKQLDDYLELGDGLFCYDGKTWIHYVSSHDVRRVSEWWVGLTIPIPTNSIGRIHIDDNGMFWIACNMNEVYSTTDIDDWHGGLIRWDGKNSWQRFMSRNAATPDSIASDLPGNWVRVSRQTNTVGCGWVSRAIMASRCMTDKALPSGTWMCLASHQAISPTCVLTTSATVFGAATLLYMVLCLQPRCVEAARTFVSRQHLTIKRMVRYTICKVFKYPGPPPERYI